jgi:hypothetical protein
VNRPLTFSCRLPVMACPVGYPLGGKVRLASIRVPAVSDSVRHLCSNFWMSVGEFAFRKRMP